MYEIEGGQNQARKERTNQDFWVQISSGGVGVFP